MASMAGTPSGVAAKLSRLIPVRILISMSFSFVCSSSSVAKDGSMEPCYMTLVNVTSIAGIHFLGLDGCCRYSTSSLLSAAAPPFGRLSQGGVPSHLKVWRVLGGAQGVEGFLHHRVATLEVLLDRVALIARTNVVGVFFLMLAHLVLDGLPSVNQNLLHSGVCCLLSASRRLALEVFLHPARASESSWPEQGIEWAPLATVFVYTRKAPPQELHQGLVTSTLVWPPLRCVAQPARCDRPGRGKQVTDDISHQQGCWVNSVRPPRP